MEANVSVSTRPLGLPQILHFLFLLSLPPFLSFIFSFSLHLVLFSSSSILSLFSHVFFSISVSFDFHQFSLLLRLTALPVSSLSFSIQFFPHSSFSFQPSPNLCLVYSSFPYFFFVLLLFTPFPLLCVNLLALCFTFLVSQLLYSHNISLKISQDTWASMMSLPTDERGSQHI